jgi:hypothetical protein
MMSAVYSRNRDIGNCRNAVATIGQSTRCAKVKEPLTKANHQPDETQFMARVRKKSLAKKTKATNTAQAPEPEATVAADSSSDMLDQLIAEHKLPPLTSASTLPPPNTEFASRVQRPDPFGEMTIALCNDNDGPKARLYRNRRFQQMAIGFDEKPDEGIRQELREDGWTWRTAESAWTKQLGERPGETHRSAVAMFASIANEIRQANGLEPVTFPAQGR